VPCNLRPHSNPGNSSDLGVELLWFRSHHWSETLGMRCCATGRVIHSPGASNTGRTINISSLIEAVTFDLTDSHHV
jgi:hypothetical protein